METESSMYAYTYSSKQNEEINNILSKYAPKEEDKMEQLRQLDQRVTQRGSVISILVGTISSLVFGIGMCCTMLWTSYFAEGIVIGVLGVIGVSSAYPIYNYVVKKERAKIADQVIALGNELLK
ncbi:MAG: hypothetical protein K2K74_05595 [Lachnospiraceae bacterium]|nr:hypothetical protein [Lachnospiraceae bacterium]